MNKVIALDIGGVCVELQHAEAFRQLNYSPEIPPPPEFLAATAKLECGQIRAEEWLAVFHEATGGKFTDEELLHAWNIIIGPTKRGMHEIVQTLVNEGYRFIYFSDTSEIHILSVYRKLSFANLISGGIFSFNTGAQKPDKRMYAEFERVYGKPCFYLDDRPSNVEAGRSHGWESHLFTTPEIFRKEFYKINSLNNIIS